MSRAKAGFVVISVSAKCGRMDWSDVQPASLANVHFVVRVDTIDDLVKRGGDLVTKLICKVRDNMCIGGPSGEIEKHQGAYDTCVICGEVSAICFVCAQREPWQALRECLEVHAGIAHAGSKISIIEIDGFACLPSETITVDEWYRRYWRE